MYSLVSPDSSETPAFQRGHDVPALYAGGACGPLFILLQRRVGRMLRMRNRFRSKVSSCFHQLVGANIALKVVDDLVAEKSSSSPAHTQIRSRKRRPRVPSSGAVVESSSGRGLVSPHLTRSVCVTARASSGAPSGSRAATPPRTSAG